MLVTLYIVVHIIIMPVFVLSFLSILVSTSTELKAVEATKKIDDIKHFGKTCRLKGNLKLHYKIVIFNFSLNTFADF